MRSRSNSAVDDCVCVAHVEGGRIDVYVTRKPRLSPGDYGRCRSANVVVVPGDNIVAVNIVPVFSDYSRRI